MTRPTDRDSHSHNVAENYERYFVPSIGRPVAANLVEGAALRPGEKVLDVACGTGIVARLAAERVGTRGAVEGLDPNPGMLAVARDSTPSDVSIAWHQGPAEAIPLPNECFDVVLCGMGLQFFADRETGLKEMRRVLVPGGRLLANVPGPMATALAQVDKGRLKALERDFSERCRDFLKEGALVGAVRMTTLTARR